MIFDDLSDHIGSFNAELVRQALTLDEFERLEIEELAPYFELQAEKTYQEYQARLASPPLPDRTQDEREAYLDILRRRWQEAQELAHKVAKGQESLAKVKRA